MLETPGWDTGLAASLPAGSLSTSQSGDRYHVTWVGTLQEGNDWPARVPGAGAESEVSNPNPLPRALPELTWGAEVGELASDCSFP